jgi:hypothetical protein
MVPDGIWCGQRTFIGARLLRRLAVGLRRKRRQAGRATYTTALPAREGSGPYRKHSRRKAKFAWVFKCAFSTSPIPKNFQAAKLGLPFVERGAADPVLATDIGGRGLALC